MVEYIVKMEKPYDIGKALYYLNVPFVEIRRVESSWRTGKPTEDGEYVVLCQYRKDDGKLRIYKKVSEFKNGEWTDLPALEGILDEYELIAWYGQKIEPYKGNQGKVGENFPKKETK